MFGKRNEDRGIESAQEALTNDIHAIDARHYWEAINTLTRETREIRKRLDLLAVALGFEFYTEPAKPFVESVPACLDIRKAKR